MSLNKTAQTFGEAIAKFLRFHPEFLLMVQRTYDDWTFKQMFRNYTRKQALKFQSAQFVQHQSLGSDIAVSKFIIKCRGKIRDQNHRWITRDRELPKQYSENFKITYIDASDCGLLDEGIDNFMDLTQVEAIDLSKNPELDDFACDQLSRQFRNSTNLKEINLSFNPYISIYGLDILFRIPSIQRITAVETLASKHEQLDIFKVCAEVERNCEVVA